MIMRCEEFKPITPTSDEELRGILQDVVKSNSTKFSLSLEMVPKSFSKWTFKDVSRTLRLSKYSASSGTCTEVLSPFDDIRSVDLDTKQKENLKNLLKGVEVRRLVMRLQDANEATKSLVISPFLVGALLPFKDDFYLASQSELSGLRGEGTADYAVLSRKDRIHVLSVTVNGEDFNQGFAQNILLLEAAVRYRKRRRGLDDIDGEEESKKPKTYGIVTDSSRWAFLECTLQDDGQVSFKASMLPEEISYTAAKDVMEKSVESVFKKLVWLCSHMKDDVCHSKHARSSQNHSPSNKRMKSGPL